MSGNNDSEKSQPPLPRRPVRRGFCFFCGIAILGAHGMCHRQECRLVTPPTLAEDTPILAEDTPTLAEDTPTLAEDTPTLAEGTPTLAEGTPTLAEGTPTLAEGTPTLAEGTPTLAEGTPTLAKATPALAKDTPTLAKDTPTLAKDTDKREARTDGGSAQQLNQRRASPRSNRGGSQLGGRGRRESLLSKQIREYDLQQAALRSGPAQDLGLSQAAPALTPRPAPAPLAHSADSSPVLDVAFTLPPAPHVHSADRSPVPDVAFTLPPAPLVYSADRSPVPDVAFTLPPAPLAHSADRSPVLDVAFTLPFAPLAQSSGPSSLTPCEDPSTFGTDVSPTIPRSEPIPIPFIGYYRDAFRSASVTPEPVPNVNVSDPEHEIFFPDSPMAAPSAPKLKK